MKRYFAAAAILLSVLITYATDVLADPITVQIETFHEALISAKNLSRGRANVLLPVLERIFNFQVMAKFVIGVSWPEMPETAQTAVTNALKRYTAARLARQIDDIEKRQLIIDPVIQSRGMDSFVKTQLLEMGNPPVHIDYRMREYGGVWKVIDVYSDGVSVMATERADFASTLEKGGATALVETLQRATDQLK